MSENRMNKERSQGGIASRVGFCGNQMNTGRFKSQRNALTVSVLFLFLSCSQPPIVVPSQGGQYPNQQQPYNPNQPGGGLQQGYQPQGGNLDRVPPPNDDSDRGSYRSNSRRRPTRRPTRVRDRGTCFTEFDGDKCEEDDDCYSLCFSIFHSRSHQDACGRRPEGLVEAFDHLLENMAGKNVEGVDGVVLKCLFAIDDGEFNKHLNKFNARSAKAFLREIAYNDDLASAVFELDEKFSIMEDLFEEAGFDRTWEFLTGEIDRRDTLLEVILQEENEDAWGWLDSYVKDKCRDYTNYCGTIHSGDADKQAFQAYCKAALDSNNSVDDIIDSEIFEADYENLITSRCVETCTIDGDDIRNTCAKDDTCSGNKRLPYSEDGFKWACKLWYDADFFP